ncbi:Mov34/MPN/PAD-1 family protein [Candidatus Bathyarchaeota archaeon]|nr:Mov34/MPN/PAD-1 family protein [Candidatus Bathyarchaeota archaeon]
MLTGDAARESAKPLKISQSVVDSILSYAKMSHPKEGILLLRGKASMDGMLVDGVVIPPSATHGHGFSSFPLGMLPSALSLVGVAHSHPNGVLQPSTEDLNHFYGRIMIITAYPYESENDLAAFNGRGHRIRYTIF